MPATTRALSEEVDVLIGDNVHQLMWRQRRRQNEVAAQLGVTSSVFSKKLRGESAWSARQVQRVAEVLRVSVAELFGEVPGDAGPHSGGVGIVRREGIEPPTRWLRAWRASGPAPFAQASA